jgi:hypothetical protein
MPCCTLSQSRKLQIERFYLFNVYIQKRFSHICICRPVKATKCLFIMTVLWATVCFEYCIVYRRGCKTVPIKKGRIFCDITPCSPLKVNRRLRKTSCFHIQGRIIGQTRNQCVSMCQERLSQEIELFLTTIVRIVFL